MTTGSRVSLDGRAGIIVGWQGELAIVAMDSGAYVTVDVSALRRVR